MAEMSEEGKAQYARYLEAAHAMQSGVAMKMNWYALDTTPKHLRVGVNGAMVEHSALAHLLIAKGLITEVEYITALADAMEAEAARYEREVAEHFGNPSTEIKLG